MSLAGRLVALSNRSLTNKHRDEIVDFAKKRHLADGVDRYATRVADLLQGGSAVGQVIALLGDQPVLGEHYFGTADSSMERHQAEVIDRHTTGLAKIFQDGAVGEGISLLDDQPVLGEYSGYSVYTEDRVEESS